MKKYIVFSILYLVSFGIFARPVNAAVNFGSGTYTNLCGTGTAATAYRCEARCNTTTGICESENNGVVRWLCPGRWEQCLEQESNFSNRASLDNVACGKTVQISVFDKKCRLEDGAWDTSCELKGYMVWYSGDCRVGSTTPTVMPTPTPRGFPFNLLPSATPRPTTPVTPTVTPKAGSVSGNICGSTCGPSKLCSVGFVCDAGVCRNPSCMDDTTCFCAGGSSSTGSGNVNTTPETGADKWVYLLGFSGLMILGWRMIVRARHIV